LALHNLRFNFYDDSGLARDQRILLFYSFDSDDRCPCSGILHYHVLESRFVGPSRDSELLAAALEFLSRSGRLPTIAVAGHWRPIPDSP
jgi:hypothetical protein